MAVPANNSSNLSRRLATAGLLIGAVLAALYAAPHTVWLALVILFIAAASWEWAKLLGLGRIPSHLFVGTSALLGTALIMSPLPAQPEVYLLASLFWLALVPLWLYRGWALPRPVLTWLVGWLLILPAALAMVFLRAESPHLLLIVIVLSSLADSAAYFTGRAFGRHKLAPQISPSKTWEGAIGGWVVISVFALILAGIGPICDGVCAVRLVLAIWVLFVLGVVGDLFESWIKRRAGVKDSGTLLPGHGGVLDRVDSHLAVLPVAALFWMWFFG